MPGASTSNHARRPSEPRLVRCGFTMERRLRPFAVLLFANQEGADSGVAIDVELELHTNPALIPWTARVARNRDLIGAVAHKDSAAPVGRRNSPFDRLRETVNDHFRGALGCGEI